MRAGDLIPLTGESGQSFIQLSGAPGGHTVRDNAISSPTVTQCSSHSASFVSVPRAKGQSLGEHLKAKSQRKDGTQSLTLPFGALIDLTGEGQKSTSGVIPQIHPPCFFEAESPLGLEFTKQAHQQSLALGLQCQPDTFSYGF